MAATSSQNYANHVRRDPPFHFFILPVLAIAFGLSVQAFINNPGFASFWGILFVAAVVVLALKSRMYANKVQDRVIRLEERLRLAGLLPEAQRQQIPKLSEDQLIALRFASDQEVPALVERALSQNLSREDIKKAIQQWRPDYWRV